MHYLSVGKNNATGPRSFFGPASDPTVVVSTTVFTYK